MNNIYLHFLADHESVALPALLLVLVGQVEAGAGELHLLAARLHLVGDLALHLAAVRVSVVGVVAEGVPVIDVDHLVALLGRAAVVCTK